MTDLALLRARSVYSAPNRLTVPLVLVLFDGRRIEVRGIVANLPRSPADAVATWDRGGRHVWVNRIVEQDLVEFVDMPDGKRYRVLYREADFSTSHFQLQDKSQDEFA